MKRTSLGRNARQSNNKIQLKQIIVGFDGRFYIVGKDLNLYSFMKHKIDNLLNKYFWKVLRHYSHNTLQSIIIIL